ncbi:MAG TPA: carbamoyltransferase C-terminal domain-containing protein, partial [Burkholderiaceae bacterium]|nr:carbamoyltransferase C-terminal domain-containing protein [Burkholderiaceae bacterium]
TVLDLAHWLHQKTRAHDLCLAGGVALNCVMNARLRDEGPFERVWVQPAAGDAGTALGAALWLDWHDRAARGTGVLLAPHVERRRRWRMDHACLGPAFDDDSIEDALVRAKISYRRVDNIAEAVAPLLARERIVGWFQGRMEFGPRALGARSILASPIPHDMQRRLNALKDREDFRPVAPMVLEERAHQWFSTSRQQCRAVANGPPIVEDDGLPAPFMTFTFNVRPERRDRIPAVRHIDGSARVQTVNRAQHPLCHALIEAFERHTGVPVIVNTSFNTLGRPIVCTPRDALEAFFTSPIDALAIGSFIVEKPV